MAVPPPSLFPNRTATQGIFWLHHRHHQLRLASPELNLPLPGAAAPSSAGGELEPRAPKSSSVLSALDNTVPLQLIP